MDFEKQNPRFFTLPEKKQQQVLKLYAVFPSSTTYGKKPTLDEFMEFTDAAKSLGYSIDRLWQLYSGWQETPAVIHALATEHAKNWSK